MDKITEYILEQTKQLLAIDSPTGYTKEASDYLMQEYSSLGYQPEKTVKGGVLVDLGGPKGENPLSTKTLPDFPYFRGWHGGKTAAYGCSRCINL